MIKIEENSANLNVEVGASAFIAANVEPKTKIDVVVGDVAKMDVQKAVNYIQSGKAEINQAVDEGLDVFNQNAELKTQDFNDNALSKTQSFDENFEDKTQDFNQNALEKTSAFNQNAADKTEAFNSNYTEKLSDFNTNSDNKTTAFNTNALSQTQSFDENAAQKTTAFTNLARSWTNDFNDNYSIKMELLADDFDNKLSAFDANAASKTQSFNQNATSQTTAFNTNANQKLSDYNDNANQKEGALQTYVQDASGFALDAKASAESAASSATSAAQSAEEAAATASNMANKDLSNLSPEGEAKFDLAGAANTAETNAKNYADSLSVNYATAEQGALADTSLQPNDNISELTNNVGYITISALTPYALKSSLAAVATSGSYNDLSNKPTIPAAQVNSDWTANSGVAQILNKPTIPIVNDATITITQGGVTKGSFTLNQASGDTIALDAGGSGVWGSITGTLSDQTDLQNALDAKVNKSGDTMTGILNINRTTGSNFVGMQSGQITRGTTPSSTITLGFMELRDKNNAWVGKNQMQFNSSGEYKMEISTRNASNDTTSKLSVGFDANNVAFATAPATSSARTNATDIVTRGFFSSSLSPYALSSSLSTVATSGSYNDLSDKPTINTYTAGTGIDVTNNVISVASPTLTTVNSSKTQNGYYELGNGLIINWGWISNLAAGTIVTFSKAFTSSTSYGLCVTPHNGNNTSGYSMHVNTTTATSFKIAKSTTGNVYGFYIAVGY